MVSISGCCGAISSHAAVVVATLLDALDAAAETEVCGGSADAVAVALASMEMGSIVLVGYSKRLPAMRSKMGM
jgi:hypothetical protein